MTSTENPRLSKTILNLLLKFLLNDPSAIFNVLFDVFQHIPVIKSLPGMYEVLDYSAQLQLKDNKGRVAVYRKRQKVRFLQNDVIAFQDQAWGDGEIFSDYQCSPGIEVDRYPHGNRYYILISLRETKHRDDELTFHIKRKIKDGFTEETESFQTEIDHRTRQLKLSVVFPKSRLPTSVKLFEKNSKRSITLDSEYRQILPDGEHEYTWETKKARLYEAYIIRWQW